MASGSKKSSVTILLPGEDKPHEVGIEEDNNSKGSNKGLKLAVLASTRMKSTEIRKKKKKQGVTASKDKHFKAKPHQDLLPGEDVSAQELLIKSDPGEIAFTQNGKKSFKSIMGKVKENEINGVVSGRRQGFANSIDTSINAICNIFADGSNNKKRQLKDSMREAFTSDMDNEETMEEAAKILDTLNKAMLEETEKAKAAKEERIREEEAAKVEAKEAKAAMEKFKQNRNNKKQQQQPANSSNPEIGSKLSTFRGTVNAARMVLNFRREWNSPNWDRIMEELKEEGRDLATIDKDLQEISHSRDQSHGKTRTGKYLMPEDIGWCRKYTRFKERQLLQLLKKYRARCPDGKMGREDLSEMIRVAFPLADGETFADIFFEIYDVEMEGILDFKVRRLTAHQLRHHHLSVLH